jgi:sterol desaturase/sphingolipid hydroxylase (fatty acid hydroxylase superfamily)
MNTTDLLLYAGIATYPLLWLLERLFPAVPLPRRPLWELAGLLFLTAFMLLSIWLPAQIPPSWFEISLVSLALQPLWLQVLAGYAVYTLIGYCWHRSAHHFDWQWRTFHQMHHFAPRLDVAGSYLFHPLEGAAYTAIAIVATVTLLGLHPVAGSAVGFLSAFNAVFQHANIRTPRWIGYLVQRPEAHAVHHQTGLHRYNYADLPLWDLLFGTYRSGSNPRREVGFGELGGAEWAKGLALRNIQR